MRVVLADVDFAKSCDFIMMTSSNNSDFAKVNPLMVKVFNKQLTKNSKVFWCFLVV